MPPLVWREKVAICPACMGIVRPEDSACPFCKAEFETPLSRNVIRAREASTREALWLAAVVSTSVLSVLFLAVAIFLSELHRFVPPVHENAVLYSAILSAIMLASVCFLSINRRRERAGIALSHASRTLPFAMTLISSVLLVMVAFAREIDRMLAEEPHYILIAIAFLFTVLILSYSRFLTGLRIGKSEN